MTTHAATLPSSGPARSRRATVDAMNNGEWFGGILTVIGAPVVIDHLKGRRDRRKTQKAALDAAPFASNEQVRDLFTENASLRQELREEVNDLRSALNEEQRRNIMLTRRVSEMEEELTEWRAGTRGLYGVWVAVPAEIWRSIRDGQIPPLPPQLPGEDRRLTVRSRRKTD